LHSEAAYQGQCATRRNSFGAPGEGVWLKVSAAFPERFRYRKLSAWAVVCVPVGLGEAGNGGEVRLKRVRPGQA